MSSLIPADDLGAYDRLQAAKAAGTAPEALKVKDLHALLGEHIAHGRGDDDLYVYPGGSIDYDDPLMDVWGLNHNYPITDIDWTDDDDHFVNLTFDRDKDH